MAELVITKSSYRKYQSYDLNLIRSRALCECEFQTIILLIGFLGSFDEILNYTPLGRMAVDDSGYSLKESVIAHVKYCLKIYLRELRMVKTYPDILSSF